MFRARLRARLCRGKEGLHRAPTFVRQFGGYTHICYYFYPPPTIVHFFIHFCLKYTHFDNSSTLKRRPQTSVTAADLVWVCAPPRTIRKWLRRLAFWILRTRAQDPCSCCCRPGVGLRPAADHPQMVTTPGVLNPSDPRARSLQLLLQTWCGSAPRRGPSSNGYDAWRFESVGPARNILAAAAGVLDPADPGARSLQSLLQTWCGSAPRRGPSANGYDAWRFGSCGPGRKILAAAAADLVWVCAPPRTILKWLRRLAF